MAFCRFNATRKPTVQNGALGLVATKTEPRRETPHVGVYLFRGSLPQIGVSYKSNKKGDPPIFSGDPPLIGVPKKRVILRRTPRSLAGQLELSPFALGHPMFTSFAMKT